MTHKVESAATEPVVGCLPPSAFYCALKGIGLTRAMRDAALYRTLQGRAIRVIAACGYQRRDYNSKNEPTVARRCYDL